MCRYLDSIYVKFTNYLFNYDKLRPPLPLTYILITGHVKPCELAVVLCEILINNVPLFYHTLYTDAE